MTRDDIIRMAREAGFQTDMFGLGIWDSSEFNKFASLVAATEREACAVMINILQKSGIGEEHLVEAIRARGQV